MEQYLVNEQVSESQLREVINKMSSILTDELKALEHEPVQKYENLRISTITINAKDGR